MRVRFRFVKLGKIRWTSHRDLARMWERAFRRVELPLAYTAGFSPRPKVSFGLALPTGYESVAEYLDIELDPSRVDGLDIATLPTKLSDALPAGVDVTAAGTIDDRTASLQHEVTSCEWTLLVAREDGAGTEEVRLRELAAGVLAASEVVVTRERKGQAVTEDVRPSILSIEVFDGGFRTELATQPRAFRPTELLAAMDATLVERLARRETQWILRADGAREDPLPRQPVADAPPAALLERV